MGAAIDTRTQSSVDQCQRVPADPATAITTTARSMAAARSRSGWTGQRMLNCMGLLPSCSIRVGACCLRTPHKDYRC